MFTKHPTKCNICGGLVKYIPNKEIYGKSYGSGFCYYCTNCGAYVGTHVPQPKVALGILAKDNEKIKINNKFSGKTFCITGKLTKYENRDKLVDNIEKYGGKIVSSVTSKTNYLITNDPTSGSSKNQKAIKFGTKIITEDDFIAMCKE